MFFSIPPVERLWIAWSKRLEPFVKLMSKNSISVDLPTTSRYPERWTMGSVLIWHMYQPRSISCTLGRKDPYHGRRMERNPRSWPLRRNQIQPLPSPPSANTTRIAIYLISFSLFFFSLCSRRRWRERGGGGSQIGRRGKDHVFPWVLNLLKFSKKVIKQLQNPLVEFHTKMRPEISENKKLFFQY